MSIYAMTGDGHWIKEVKEGGKIIILEDVSRWEVSPINIVETCMWLPMTDITVEDGDDPSYPYKLINTEDKEEVDANYLSSN